MDRSFLQRNTESRERLHAFLTSGELPRKWLAGGWTLGAVLAHLAFWDRMVEVRWDQYEREGAIDQLPDGLITLLNAAGLPEWRAMPPRRAADLALEAADAVDRRIEGLSDAAVEYALSTGRSLLLERSPHRREHLDEIERALAG